MTGAPLSNAARRQRSVLYRFGHLLSLNTDLDRSASDTRFWGRYDPAVEGERKIYYVFDENVFELFINPLAQWRYCANFYGPQWGREAVQTTQFSAQAGMIAAEYLFSRNLVGLGPDDPVFMTEWHLEELRRRLFSYRRKLGRAARGLKQPEAVVAYLAEHNRRTELHSDASPKEILERALDNAPTDLADDARLFLKQGDDPEAALRFVVASELASILVGDTVVEALQQLDRVYSEILPEVRPLAMWFDPHLDRTGAPTERNRAELVSLIDQWTRFLQGNYSHQSKRGRIANDAKSLAFVHWIAKHRLSREQRIVFVTGDTQLYSAYVDWHAEQPVGEAFLLRRVNQYAPLINPHDTPNDIRTDTDRGNYLFDSIRVAVDAPQVSFNISNGVRGRAYMAEFLRRSRSPEIEPQISYFTRRLDDRWWKERDSIFRTLRDQWRKAERLAIGASLPVLQRRLDRRQALLTRLAAEPANSAGEAFSSYLSDILERIAKEGIRTELEDAARLLARRPDQAARKRAWSRAPLDVKLRVPTPGAEGQVEEVELATLLDQWLGGDEQAADLLDPSKNPVLLDRLDIVYGVAAALAIRVGNWADADRFAENAVTAAEIHQSRDDLGENEAWLECLYLSALAKRFVIASTPPSDDLAATPGKTVFGERDDLWADSLRQAIERLDQVEREHRRLRQPRRVLRAISERIAVRLFYTTWLATTPRAILVKAGYDIAGALREYSAVRDDIRRGWEIIDGLQEHGALNGPRHLSVNAAAFALVGRLLQEAGFETPALESDEMDRVERAADDFLTDLKGCPPIVALDLHSFLFLCRGRASAIEGVRVGISQKYNLPLDASFVRSLRKLMGSAIPGRRNSRHPRPKQSLG